MFYDQGDPCFMSRMVHINHQNGSCLMIRVAHILQPGKSMSHNQGGTCFMIREVHVL